MLTLLTRVIKTIFYASIHIRFWIWLLPFQLKITLTFVFKTFFFFFFNILSNDTFAVNLIFLDLKTFSF